MDFVNETPVQAGWTMGFDRDGRELVIVAIKATFHIPLNGEESTLAEEQVPLTEADEFTGEPGFSAPLYETDYAHRRPYCDVLINGSAYATRGEPTQRVTVSATVGSMSKSFDVVGNRVWRDGIVAPSATQPEPFTVMPISYDNAFGGVDASHPNPSKLKTFLPNPVGRGYHPHLREIDGKPLPNTEEKGKTVKDPGGNYRPMSFGPIGRNWQPRVNHAGTYDEKWLNDQAPFWPDDFDYRYFQATREDQQMPYPRGGEVVILTNLTPDGLTRFRLPKLPLPIVVIPADGREQVAKTVIDTVLIEPDKQRFILTMRAALPMRRSCFDIRQMIVGEHLRSVRRARKAGTKKRYANLDEMIRAKNPTRER